MLVSPMSTHTPRAPTPGPKNLLSLYLPAFILALGTGIATPALPVFARSFDIGFGLASLVIIVHLGGSAAAALPTGFLIDRVGRRNIVLAGPILTAITSVLTAIAGSFPELLVYRFLNGWAIGMWTMARITMIADAGGERRGRQITSMFAMDNAGRLIGPALGGFVAAASDVRVPFLLHGALSLLAVIPSFSVVRDTRPGEGARAGGKTEGDASPNRPLLAEFLVFPIMILLVAYMLVSMTRGALYGGSLNFYAVYVYDIGPETLGLLAAAVSAVGLPIQVLAGHIMDRFGRKMTIVPGFTLLSAALVVTALTAFLHLPFETYVVALIIVTLTMSLTGGSMQTLGSDVAPPHARGKFFGIWSSIGHAGTFLSPAMFALISESLGYGSAFLFLSMTSLSVALLIGLFVKETLKSRQTPASAPQPT